jgi:hypothetical protein
MSFKSGLCNFTGQVTQALHKKPIGVAASHVASSGLLKSMTTLFVFVKSTNDDSLGVELQGSKVLLLLLEESLSLVKSMTWLKHGTRRCLRRTSGCVHARQQAGHVATRFLAAQAATQPEKQLAWKRRWHVHNTCGYWPRKSSMQIMQSPIFRVC